MTSLPEPTPPVSATPTEYIDELALLLDTLPAPLRAALDGQDLNQLIEVVLDYGRLPEARFLGGTYVDLGQQPVTLQEIEEVVARVGAFSGDNRAGIPRTLHRISAIRNRGGEIIGLTCRVGKPLVGTIEPIKDLVTSGKSILFLGRPGVGKTTKLREVARLIADELGKRVVIIDTSNEIAGDGDIPHAAVGRSRRMQVPHPDQQQHIMIEAVENHTPEVIIVDEIGTEEEAQAARTIAERGVILIATAHGGQLDNLIKNPVLSDLVGGIQSVTLGDDEAKRRASQKTILEREKQPTFDICVELQDRNTMAIYPNLAEAVDHLLRGWTLFPEVRKTNELGEIQILQPKVAHAQGRLTPQNISVLPMRSSKSGEASAGLSATGPVPDIGANAATLMTPSGLRVLPKVAEPGMSDEFRIFLYGITKSFVDRILDRMNLARQLVITEQVHDAHAVLALRGQARPGSKILRLATDYDVPVYYAKTNTQPQIQRALREALETVSHDPASPFAGRWLEKTRNWLESVAQPSGNEDTQQALEEAREAIGRVMMERKPVELAPRRSYIRRLQHELVERHNLLSLSIGDEPDRCLKILPPVESSD